MNLQEDDVKRPATKPTRAWITPLATLVAGLVIGVLIGYAGRPLVTPQPLSPTPVAPASGADPPAAGDATPSARNADVSSLMEAVVAQTRHFKGDPNAPVTIVEFGDFQ